LRALVAAEAAPGLASVPRALLESDEGAESHRNGSERCEHMASGATVYHFVIELSDVDRATYAALDLRLARHPSESLRYLFTRTLAYCLSYEAGIAFSKGGLSESEDPPVAIWDDTGALRAWIDVGAPSAKRLHKATKAAPRVAVFTQVPLPLLIAEASSSPIHRLDQIEVWPLEPSFVERVSSQLERNTQFGLTRSDGNLYLSLGGETIETTLALTRLTSPAA
jgi:uncharacterized protein YaeQ